MEKIALPQKMTALPGSQLNEELIIVEPFFPGYGTTVGNALRRVLLSSLPGAAVVGVKVSGAEHEFMGLPGIQEDILAIVLNLKKLRLQIFSEEICKLTLDVSGKKVVTAADITPNSQVEIINSDLVLANLTSSDAVLTMEIFVSNGRGYEMVENRPKVKKEIGYIEIDSIFSPVLSVSIDVESARVGKMTNWDKLVLNIKTDKTITPKEAFEQSIKILVDQFSALLPGVLTAPAPDAEEESEETLVEEEVEVEEKSKKKAKK